MFKNYLNGNNDILVVFGANSLIMGQIKSPLGTPHTLRQHGTEGLKGGWPNPFWPEMIKISFWIIWSEYRQVAL